ncbi:hypothetical protein ACFX13_034012 [Malus domestica]
MERHLFNKIMTAVCNHDSYFMQKNDVFGVMGLFPEQKINAALRMLAYRASADQVDEVLLCNRIYLHLRVPPETY